MKQTIRTEAVRQEETNRRNIAIKYFKLVSALKFKEGLRFFASDCKTHNPYVSAGANMPNARAF